MSFRLRWVSSSFLMQNVVSPQAFMSSSIATEAVQESSTSKAYGSEQIQVLEGLDPVRKRPGILEAPDLVVCTIWFMKYQIMLLTRHKQVLLER